MERSEVENKINEIIMELLGYKMKIKPEHKIWDDLGIDSLDWVEIVLVVQDTYNKEFSESELEKITTVGEFVDYVYSQVKGG